MNKSIFELLEETGYFQVHSKISEEVIEKQLKKYPEYVNEWISYSEDKRGDSGYYIKREGKIYIIGYLDKQGKIQILKKTNNRVNACAIFIKKEIEDIRLRQQYKAKE
jgi:ribosomal protein L36